MKRRWIVLALVPSLALAENAPPKPVPAPQPAPVSQSLAGATAGAAAAATGGDAGALALSSPVVTVSPVITAAPTADALGVGGAGGNAGAEATGGGGVGTVYGDTTNVRARALGLVIPGVTAAPAVPGACLTHSRGWGVLGMGATGGTRIDATCAERQQCLAIADRFAQAGMWQAMADQLATCGAVKAAAPSIEVTRVPAAPVDLSSYVRRDELRETADRITRQMVSK